MISNEAVQRLIATDRETLIALMAAAADRHGDWNLDRDPDIRALIEAARERNKEVSAFQWTGFRWEKRA